MSDSGYDVEADMADDLKNEFESISLIIEEKNTEIKNLHNAAKDNSNLMTNIQTKKTLFHLKQTLLPLIYQRNAKQWEGCFHP